MKLIESKPRRFLAAAIAASTFAAIALPSGASAATTLRFGHANNNGEIATDLFQEFADNVGKRTKGEVRIRIFPAEQLGKARDMLTLTQTTEYPLQGRVVIEVGLEQPEPGRRVVRIMVDDDGPGLTPSEREQVARRGRRLDETKPGSGLGLSIVVELAGLYGGALNLGNAPIGGLRAELVLPAAG